MTSRLRRLLEPDARFLRDDRGAAIAAGRGRAVRRLGLAPVRRSGTPVCLQMRLEHAGMDRAVSAVTTGDEVLDDDAHTL